MFNPADREEIKADIVAFAKADERITGGAITGSASVGKEDEWSDIDLAFGVEIGVSLQSPLNDFTDRMYGKHQAVTHMDVRSGTWIYRVFLLENTLQVDIAFAPASDFGPKAQTFKLLFGRAVDNDGLLVGSPDKQTQIDLAWLYALHVRSSILRGKYWQAEYMINHMRECALSLACLRHGLLTIKEGRSYHELPLAVSQPFKESLVRSLDSTELKRAFLVLTNCFLAELKANDGLLANKLGPTLLKLAQLD